MTSYARSRFFEGGNRIAAMIVPAVFLLSLVYYPAIAARIQPLGIKIEDVYTYIFNLFAIELGALLSLFGLFVCRPTPFLERIKSTSVFAAIVANNNITLVLTATAIAVTFVLGLLRHEPEMFLTVKSAVFVGWVALVALTSAVYARTVRFMLTALS